MTLLALRSAYGLNGSPPTTWVRRTVVQAPRNGTTSHTITFAAADVGNLLVLVLEGAVTNTVPTGWTRQTQALQNTELSVYTKTAAAGESSFSTTHNGSNYPIVAVVYEFYAGSTYVNGVSGTAQGTNGPALSGLTGTNMVFASTGIAQPSTGGNNTAADFVGMTDDVELLAPGTSASDGYFVLISYLNSYTGASYSPTISIANQGNPREAVTFAIKPVGAPVVTPPAATSLLYDGFNRTNSTSAGTADTGQVWSQNVGDWGTDGSTLGSTSMADGNQISVDVGTKVQEFSAKLVAGIAANAYPAWLINWEAGGTYYRAEASPTGQITVSRGINSTFTNFGTSATGALANGSTLRFKSDIGASSTLLTVWVDDVQVAQFTDDWQAAGRPAPVGTRVGFRHGAAAGGIPIRWDDAYVNRGVSSSQGRFFLLFQ